jgi:AcrR family transcriptional regulator
MFPPRVPRRASISGREAHQLPPGRHGLSRAFVAQNQRDRILAAVADVTSVAGYGDMSVEDVIVTAGVSRRTFYEHFKNKHDAFIAAYDTVVTGLLEGVRLAYQSEETFPERLRAGLGAFLDFVAREPAFARMCIVEALAAGPDAVKRRNAAMAAFAKLIDENARELGTALHPPSLTGETIVGGIYEVVYARIVAGEIRTLPNLLPDLLYSALLPYVGHEEATAASKRQREAADAAGP